ncbi:FtsX-like permease family protein [Anaerocolumna cellulosilytica]|uniref:FtsX-like permease family protein n=1 Tax=Anaerocolumna cellulosilytica TaxID=433286 RepID=UPI00161B0A04|nr:ABC transporter permease [Anaerocolumna cellulosilytica]MBB5195961.1 putative ABC transport system permease protein [Anaerocolumna cellulosilytica]
MLVYKQLVKQLLHNKIFVSLLLLLTVLTSLSFYFVIFSIDGNMAVLNTLTTLTENQQLYKNALDANTSLAYTFFISTIVLTSFVFVMFFYRFYRGNKKQIGCIKALGFKDSSLRACFVYFVAVLSVIGTVLGLVGGYFLSDVLIHANTNTYSVTGLVKGVSLMNLFVGLIVSTAMFCLIAFLCYFFIKGKGPGLLMGGNRSCPGVSFSLKAANCISGMIPTKNKFPLRIALRKPLSICLILVAVMSFTVCIILGRSLNSSSQKIFETQTMGHNYEYDTTYSEYQTTSVSENMISYLENTSRVFIGSHEIEQTMTGFYTLNSLYELQDTKENILSAPKAGTVYINPSLYEVYGLNIGDRLVTDIAGISLAFTVANIATNAKSANIYVNVNELSKILNVPIGAYNGILSTEKINGDVTITKEQRIDILNRLAVSNKISAVINQSIGGVVGAILIFIALYVNFQDNTHDILILYMMGYQTRRIRQMLIDVYMPIVWTAFFLTLAPGIGLARLIQKSLSISTNDYMPFGTSIFVVVLVFLGLNIIYLLIQVLFELAIKRIITKEAISFTD